MRTSQGSGSEDDNKSLLGIWRRWVQLVEAEADAQAKVKSTIFAAWCCVAVCRHCIVSRCMRPTASAGIRRSTDICTVVSCSSQAIRSTPPEPLDAPQRGLADWQEAIDQTRTCAQELARAVQRTQRAYQEIFPWVREQLHEVKASCKVSQPILILHTHIHHFSHGPTHHLVADSRGSAGLPQERSARHYCEAGARARTHAHCSRGRR